MGNRLTWIAALALGALAGCNNGNSSNPVNNIQCVMALSGTDGSANGLNCSVGAEFNPTKNQSTIGLGYSPPVGTIGGPTVAADLLIMGDVATGTYGLSDATVIAPSSATASGENNAARWVAEKGMNGRPDTGSFSVTITSATLAGTQSDGNKEYSLHGTADGMLPALTGTDAKATQTLHADF